MAGCCGEHSAAAAGAGEGDVHQACLLLQLGALLGGVVGVVGGKYALADVGEYYLVVLQALGGVNGGQEHVSAARRVGVEQQLQLVQPRREVVQRLRVHRQRHQRVGLGACRTVVVQMEVLHHRADGGIGTHGLVSGHLLRLALQCGKVASGESQAVGELLEHVLPAVAHLFGDKRRYVTADAVAQVVERLAVAGVVGQADQRAQVAQRIVAEQRWLTVLAADGEGHAAALERGGERGQAVVVAAEHAQRTPGRERLSATGDLSALSAPVAQRAAFHDAAAAGGSGHVLLAAVGVVLYDAAARVHDLGAGSVVGLHIEHARTGMGVLEVHQVIGGGAAEAVDALILVAHEEQVAARACQLVADALLDGRGVLRLVDLDVVVGFAVALQQRRHDGERAVCEREQVIKVHHATFALEAAIVFVQLLEVEVIVGACAALGRLQCVADAVEAGQRRLQRILVYEAVDLLSEQSAHHRGAVLTQLEHLAAGHAAVGAEDVQAQRVDRGKARLGQLWKQVGEAAIHVQLTLLAEGQGEYARIGHAEHAHQAGGAADDDGGLAAAGRCDQQAGAVGLLHRGALLGAERDVLFRCEPVEVVLHAPLPPFHRSFSLYHRVRRRYNQVDKRKISL